MANNLEEEQNGTEPEPDPTWDGVPMGIDEVYKPSLEVMQDTLRRAGARRRTIAKWKAGRTTFRVLPPYKPDGGFYEVVRWHWEVGPERKGMLCRQSFGEPCYLCEKYRELAASNDRQDQDEAERIAAKTRYLANVIVLGEEAQGVQVIELKERMAKVLVELALDPEVGNFTDPVTGRNASLEKTGSGLKTRYSEPRIAANPSPIPSEDWMQRIKHLDRFFVRPSRRDQLERYEGLEGDEFN
jgi:gp32 DNA binding protein like